LNEDNEGAGGNRRRRQIDENGMVIPAAMRNYRERDILYRFIRLRKCDRIDMCWGYFKNVERDLIRVLLFVGSLAMVLCAYIAGSTDYSK